MTTHWLLRVGDGNNLYNSVGHGIWGIQSTTTFGKNFIKEVKNGDKLWFIKSQSNGKILGVATYKYHNKRNYDIGLTNEELGWIGSGPDWTSDLEVHFKEWFDLDEQQLLTHIKGSSTIRKYNYKCSLDLEELYEIIYNNAKPLLSL